MENINLISVILEAVIVLLSLTIAFQKKQTYGFGLAFTFLIYVFYDLTRIQGWQISSQITSISFLIATILALLSIYSIYKKS